MDALAFSQGEPAGNARATVTSETDASCLPAVKLKTTSMRLDPGSRTRGAQTGR
jgi:hypothetical protein